MLSKYSAVFFIQAGDIGNLQEVLAEAKIMLAETNIDLIVDLFGIPRNKFVTSGDDTLDTSRNLGLGVVQISDIKSPKHGLKGLSWFVGIFGITPAFDLQWGNPVGTWVEETYGKVSFVLSFIYGQGWMLEPVGDGRIFTHVWPVAHKQIVFRYTESKQLVLKAAPLVVSDIGGSQNIDLSLIEWEIGFDPGQFFMGILSPVSVWIGFNSESSLSIFQPSDHLAFGTWIARASNFTGKRAKILIAKSYLEEVKREVFKTHALLIGE